MSRKRAGPLLTLNGGALNVGHVLAVRELAEERGGSNDDVDTVDTCLNSNPGVVHVASDVGENPEVRAGEGGGGGGEERISFRTAAVMSGVE